MKKLSARLIALCKVHILLRNLSSEKAVPLAYNVYEVQGIQKDTPPVLVLHGIFGGKVNWRSHCSKLSEETEPKRKVFALDLRNHGDSPHVPEMTYDHMINDLKQFIEDQKIKKACLLGHSMGGLICIAFTLKYPSLVDRLLVLDIWPKNIPPSDNLPKILKVLDDFEVTKTDSLREARKEVEAALTSVLRTEFVRQFVAMNLMRTKDGKYKWRLNVPVILQNLNNIVNFPEGVTGTFEGPVLFLGGKKSKYIPKEDKEDIKDWFPKAEIKYIDGGHFLHMEKPREFLEATLKFLNKQHELSFF